MKKKSLIGWTYADWEEFFKYTQEGRVLSPGISVPLINCNKEIVAAISDDRKMKISMPKRVRITIEEIDAK